MTPKVIRGIEEAASSFTFIKNIIKFDETEHTVKYRLIIEQDLFIQVYINTENDTIGFVLINNGQRIYGRDAIDGNWHRHTFEDPLAHDFSAEGSRKITLKEFLIEVQEILDRECLL